MQVLSPPLLEVRDLVKVFGPVRANDGISFSVRPGEVHALLGENGAGKSTLVKSLYGVHQPEAGQILIDEEPVTLSSPAAARQRGIGMVFQDMRLIPALPVWQNIALHLTDTPWVMRPKALKARIAELSQRYGLAVHPDALVEHLSIGEWQRVELIKVLLGGLRLLILDEPTSVLTPQEVGGLFEVIERLKADGAAIVIITHKLREVRQIADRVTVLRGGRTVLSDAEPARLTDEQLITAMVGEPVAALERRSTDASDAASAHAPIVRLENVSIRRPDGALGLDRVSLEVFPGQILGVAGVAGSGQDELSETILGLRQPVAGTVALDGAELALPAVRQARQAGIVAVASDPVQDFVIPGMSVAEHAALWFAEGRFRFDTRRADAQLRTRSDAAQLRAVAGNRRMDRLSGGNIQRVLLTLALTSTCRVLVASYPTRGLDILTTERTRTLIKELCESGVAVVLVSEDLDELLTLSDRIAVLSGGELTGVVPAATADRRRLGELMAGGVAA